MQVRDDHQQYFATDLTDFLACRHLSTLERLSAHGMLKRPFTDDPMLEVLRARGLEHEAQYVATLRSSGKSVVEIVKNDPNPFAKTLTALRSGVDVVVQARLEHARWAGWADVLLRVPGQSAFGDWRYEPLETKLATETRGATLLQLCLYAELLHEIQGAPPEYLRVVKPDTDFAAEIYRFAEFRAYFRLVRRNFEQAMAQPLPEFATKTMTYPEPVAHCDVCNWHSQCRQRWTQDDSVCLVAGIQKTQRRELADWGITKLEQFAILPLPFTQKPRRGSIATLERYHRQAELQLAARALEKPPYELLRIEAEQGLASLPPPSPLDIFLDLEGDRLAEKGGFDYLFGYTLRDESGEYRYEAAWALSPEEEKLAFERFIDLVLERRLRDAGMHVYHYAPYEPTAMKRLMGRYATRADELDVLLRGKVFVDLYSVVRRGFQAGVESYSIKKLEPLYGLVREVDLQRASRQMKAVESAIARKDYQALTPEMKDVVQGYNRDDCMSALELHQWLESLRLDAEKQTGWPVPRPDPPTMEVSEELQGQLAQIRMVADALLAGLPLERNAEQEACWILAQVLEWHRREEKVAWWEYFRLNDMPADEFIDEADGLGQLKFEDRLEQTKRGVVIDRYSFPPQDTDIRAEDDIFLPGAKKPGKFATVEAINLSAGTIDLRKGAAKTEHHPKAVFTHDNIRNADAISSLLRLGEFVRDHGIDAAGAFRSARDLLLRRGPRLTAGVVLRLPDENTVQSARRAVRGLNEGVLAIQGPPGAGKTFSGARMIIDLVAAGMKVGITAVSHKVIRNLLKGVVEAAREESRSVQCLHRVSEKSPHPDADIEEETDSKKGISKILNGAHDVIGGTAWVWTKDVLAEAVDVLFVDEAGQMSLGARLSN
jgi:predicted RecB family nuclease